MDLNISPVFFDYFGFIIWVFLLGVSIKDLKNNKLVKWKRFVLLFIALIGIFLDGFILIFNFLGSNIVNHAWKADFLGIPVFLFIIFLGFDDLKNKDISRNIWTKYVLLLIGFLGLFADGFILFSYLY